MAKKPNIIPLGDRVLIRPLSEDELSTASALGIIIPETAKKGQTGQGEIIAIGEGKLLDTGKRVTPQVSVGDRVMYSKYSYEEVSNVGHDYHIVSGDNILAIIK